jgi:HEAT repeat protein
MTIGIVERARALLAAGQAVAARDLLLAEGFVKCQEPELQRVFPELIPPSPSLARRLESLETALSRPDAEARYNALKAISRDVFQETSLHIKEWAADPRFIDPLIGALSDPDPKVVEEAAAVLSVVVSRYFADQRMFEPLVRLLQSRRKKTRLYAVTAIAHLTHPHRWQALLPVFRDPAHEVRHAACRAVLFNLDVVEVSPDLRAALKTELRARVADENTTTRAMAERALQKLRS